GLDANRLIRDVKSGAHAKRLREDLLNGERDGIEGTPAFFVNGVRFGGSWDGLYAALINNELG
ncbi:MAG: DsbA family protein, partial [Bryobacteraceae bacterium]